MAETILPATKRTRKSKPKVRALKDHRPTLFIDIERAEALAKEIQGYGFGIHGLFNEFVDIVRTPFIRSYQGDKDLDDIGSFARNVNYHLQSDYSTLLHTMNHIPHTLDAAISALKILKRIMDMKKADVSESASGESDAKNQGVNHAK